MMTMRVHGVLMSIVSSLVAKVATYVQARATATATMRAAATCL